MLDDLSGSKRKLCGGVLDPLSRLSTSLKAKWDATYSKDTNLMELFNIYGELSAKCGIYILKIMCKIRPQTVTSRVLARQ
ncbi:hypothetical protein CEXT_88651 [Caerostris extrusa]|uniref:Uncharacterized protein n=1 Tax=Caerostris extrusa TaxID=172846 RepID=A0AAV4X8P2_CAEEX|nr:hypothetical protein CEXT_88651 [Caerostris extrusa]